MQDLTEEVKELIDLIKRKEKLVAMLAPSFVVDFKYPEVVGMLKRLGFKYVVEVSRGAIETNKQLIALLKLHPDKRWITSPCPVVVRNIRTRYPHLVEYLTPIDSPMSATAKIIDKEYPGYKKVHFSPCFGKKYEAKEDHPELNILTLTYRELAKVFEIKKIKAKKGDQKTTFDITGLETRLYPISGGLAQSSGIIKKYTDTEYDVISGPLLVDKILKEFSERTDLKILDILNCDGGCINGPGTISKDSLEDRRNRVTEYWKSA